MAVDVQHPGVTLLENYLRPLGIRAKDLAASLGLEERKVGDLLAGGGSITPDVAARLALFFDVPIVWWLELQARYDAAQLGELESLHEVVTPYEGLSRILVTPRGVKLLDRTEAPRPETTMEKVSQDFIERLRAQVELAEPEGPRKVSQITYDDGSVALVGD